MEVPTAQSLWPLKFKGLRQRESLPPFPPHGHVPRARREEGASKLKACPPEHGHNASAGGVHITRLKAFQQRESLASPPHGHVPRAHREEGASKLKAFPRARQKTGPKVQVLDHTTKMYC